MKVTKKDKMMARSASAILASLPPRAFKDVTGKGYPCNIILIFKGLKGYSPIYAPSMTADQANAKLGVTPAQVEAMHAGSMFGWDLPVADPLNYEVNNVH